MGPRKEASDFLWVHPNVARWDTPWGWRHSPKQSRAPLFTLARQQHSQNERAKVPFLLECERRWEIILPFIPAVHLIPEKCPGVFTQPPRMDTWAVSSYQFP